MTIAAERKPKRGPKALVEAPLAWWLGELRAFWDETARRLDSGRNRIAIEAGERYWIVRRGERVLGQLDRELPDDSGPAQLAEMVPAALRHRRLFVEIPPERVLAKRIVLPAEARRELDRILEFEAARHFPFPAERVFFCHRLAGPGGLSRAFASGPLAIELIAVPREVVAEIRQTTAAAGLRLGAVTVGGAAGGEPVPLPRAALGDRTPRLARFDRALLGLVAALALAAVVSMPLAQHLRLARIESRIAALRPRAEAALARREHAQRAASGEAAVLHLRGSRPPLVAVLDALTRAVPDGAWLTALDLSGRDLVIDGLSPSAAGTALALERSGAFAGIAFRSAITRDPASGLEHFELGATVKEETR